MNEIIMINYWWFDRGNGSYLGILFEKVGIVLVDFEVEFGRRDG